MTEILLANLTDINAAVAGQIGTAGLKAATDNTQPDVVSAKGAFTTGHLLVAADANGTAVDGGPVPTGNSPGGSTGAIQVNGGSGTFAGMPAMNGDATINTTTGAISVTKTGGVAFGTAATQNTGTSGATIPLLNSANTWSGVQSINSGDLSLKGATSGSTLLNATAVASGTVTIPATTDTLVGKATTDTLTNKTIDTAGSNTIKVNGNTLSATAGTATVTVPNSTDTLVGRATADTLTNKTISGSSNTLSNIANASLTNSSITVGSTAVALGGTLAAATGRGSNGLNIEGITTHGDSIYTILATDRVVATSAAFTAARTWTLPAANSVNAGQMIRIVDAAGGITFNNTLTIVPGGTDTFANNNSVNSLVMQLAGSETWFMSDGTSKWYLPQMSFACGGNGSLFVGQKGNGGIVGFNTGSGGTIGMGYNGVFFIEIGAGCFVEQNGGQIAKYDANGNYITNKAVADQGYSQQAPTTGFTITIGNNAGSLILDPAGTLSTGTINMPATPIDGQIVRVCSTQTVTTLTVGGNGHTIKNAPTTIAAGTGFAYQYDNSNTTWYKIQ